jgi:hypothetical protein
MLAADLAKFNWCQRPTLRADVNEVIEVVNLSGVYAEDFPGYVQMISSCSESV